ncbi:LysR substrate-binding domain-containing protein [Paraburkholderia flava]|uniref:LysR substrate-binding domain-containing protein n=1 Tax=Paraburkholderia flava TaxID=2547393 RepID=UPI00105DEA8F|nr:LysR substrate-binding domain-containing protein [Paraburkholderia flava]
MSLTLSQLRAFVAVAERGSIRAAARALDTAQSGLTQQLQSLEQSLGATLFTRTNRGIALTPFGERLMLRAGAILRECERTEREMAQLRGEAGGVVSLGVATEPLIDTFAPVLMQFRARIDNVAVHLMGGTSRTMIAWIRDGTLDFAVGLVSATTDVSDLTVTTLYPSDPVVVCRRGHPLAHATSLRELADCDWIATRAPKQAGMPTNRLVDLFAAHELPPPRIVATTEAVFDTLHLIVETDCLSVEPSVVTRHRLFAGALVAVPIRERAERSNVCLLQRAGVPLTPAAQELAAMIASYARTVRRGDPDAVARVPPAG